MLDPLTALGLAGNVIQIADITWKLVSGAHELHTTGSVSALSAIKTDAENVRDQAAGLRTLLQPTIGCLTRDQAMLHALTSQIESTVVVLLEHVTFDEQRSVWNSIKGAAKTIKNKKKIVDLADKLNRVQGQLSFQILVALRSSLTEQSDELHDQFDSIRTDIRRVIALFEDSQKKTADHIDNTYLATSLSPTDSTTFAANTRRQDAADRAFEPLEGQEMKSQRGLGKSAPGKKLAILRLLRYRHMQDRRDEIEVAHQQTFEWMFRDDGHPTLWPNFLKWLVGEDITHPYWINGKAGSGKSTLMKFVAGDRRTRGALSRWSGSKEITTGACFFWNLGTTMQKSQQGLLQSLLYSVLNKHTDMIPLVFAEVWDNIGERRTEEDIPPLTFAEVKRAFSTLMSMELPFKMCFFIDGIDEYDGDHAEMCSFLMRTCSTQVKMVISSRPINACIEAFQHCPSLRLEDLTYPDIKRYVDDRLARHDKMQQLLRMQPSTASTLVAEIVTRASGVFLWVRLVVNSLLDGLRNDDQISDLQARLRLLPPDLESFYRHMLGKMSPLYREQAAEMFQIVRCARELWVNRPIQTLLLSYAQSDPQICLQLPQSPLFATEALHRCRTMENRLRSRCCGLLETKSPSQLTEESSGSTSLNDESYADWSDGARFILTGDTSLGQTDLDAINSNVQYLHRTVAEYLHREDVWSKLIKTDGESARTRAAIAVGHATLVKLKIVPLNQEDSMTWTGHLLKCCRTIEITTNRAQLPLIDELDRVMKQRWLRAGGWDRNHWADLGDNNARYHQMFVLAARIGLYAYVEHKLREHGSDLLSCGGRPLLMQVVGNDLPRFPVPSFDELPCIVSLLFSYGADPNERFDGVSSWQFAMQQYGERAGPSDAVAWSRLLSLFVANGADVHVPVSRCGLTLFQARMGGSVSSMQVVRLVKERMIDSGDVASVAATTELEDLMIEHGAQLGRDHGIVEAQGFSRARPSSTDEDGKDGTDKSGADEADAARSDVSNPYVDDIFYSSEEVDAMISKQKQLRNGSEQAPLAGGMFNTARSYLPSVPTFGSVLSAHNTMVGNLRQHFGTGEATISNWSGIMPGNLAKNIRWPSR